MDRRTFLAATAALVPTATNGGRLMRVSSPLRELGQDAARLGSWDVSGKGVHWHSASAAARSAERTLMMSNRDPRIAREVAHVASIAAYILFDAGRGDAAEHAFGVAQQATHFIEGYEGVSLRHRIGCSRVRYLVHQRHPHAAAGSVPQVGDVKLTMRELSLRHKVAARAYSNLGDAEHTLAAIRQADDHWVPPSDSDPPWLGPDGEAEHYGDTGQSLADLATLHDMARHAKPAVERLLFAVQDVHAHRRTRQFSAVTAATVMLQHGLDGGQEAAHAALDLMQCDVVQSAQASVMRGRLKARALDRGMADVAHRIDHPAVPWA